MIVNVFEFLNELQSTCAPTIEGQLVWVPPMFASMQVFVFDDSWIEEEFNPFWWEYLAAYRSQQNQPLENNARRGTCDEIAERCRSHFAEAARKFNGDVDCAAGAYFARIMLPAGGGLNNVPGPGGHEMIILATTKDQKTFKLHAYEAQNRLRTPLADAVAAGVVVRACWV